MKRKSYRSIIWISAVSLVVAASVFLPSVLAQPHPVPPPGYTYPPVPEPSPVPTPSVYKEAGSFEDVSSYGGMDVQDAKIAVGKASPEPGILINSDELWSQIETDFIPTAIEWSGNDEPTIFISDNESDKVFKGVINSSPEIQWIEIGSPGANPGQFMNPNGMYSSDENSLYVVDTGNNRLQFWNGFEWTIVASPLYSEYMVDICMVGNTTFISDNARNCIYYKTPQEQGWNIIVDPTYINYPSFMDADAEGRLYILSWVIYPDGPRKSIVRYSEGEFCVYVESGSGPGYMGDSVYSEELCITDYGSLVYSDSSTGGIYRETCKDNSLAWITVNDVPVPIADSEAPLEVTLDGTVNECVVDAAPLCKYASVTGTGVVPLFYGSNNIIITCTSESGSTREYTLNVIRDLSGDTTLTGILMNDVLLPDFDPEINIYNDISCPSDMETVEITGILLNPEATLIGEGTILLSNRETPVLLTVISENGINVGYYLLNITKSAPAPTDSPVTTQTPAPSPSSEPSVSPTSEPTPTPVTSVPPVSVSPLPSDAPEVPTNFTPTETPPIDRTPTPEPTFYTQNPWKDEYEKEMDKEIEKDAMANKVKYTIILAAVIAAISVTYVLYKKRRK